MLSTSFERMTPGRGPLLGGTFAAYLICHTHCRGPLNCKPH
jgi:hypothetical protein